MADSDEILIGGPRDGTVIAAPDSGLAEVPIEGLCIALCRYLARETAGIYQVDGEGFFTADGKIIVAEQS